MRRTTMRSASRLASVLGVASLVLVAAACGGDDDDAATSDTTAEEETVDEEPADDGDEATDDGDEATTEDTTADDSASSDAVIRLATNQLPASKGNPFNSVGSPGIYTLAAIYDPVTFVSTDGEIKPWLATSWENTSETTWNFVLRDDVQFSNGETLDAEGLASVINFIVTDEAAAGSAVARDLANIASATAVDTYTVEVTTATPDPILPAKMTEIYVPAPGVLADAGLEEITENPVGSGPFMVTSWDAGTIELAAFTDSWRAPLVGGLEIQELAEPAARVQALQAGQVDLATGISPDLVDTLGDAASADVVTANQVMSLAFNTEMADSPVADPMVRQALNYAIDRQAIVDALLLGQGSAAGQGPTPNATGYNPDIDAFGYDPELAQQMLADAGYPDGLSFTADVVVGSFPADAEIYQLAQQNLADIGVDVELNQITFPDWLERYLGGTFDAGMFGLSWNALPTMDSGRVMTNFSCLKSNPFFCDQEQADALEAALPTIDPAERTAALQDVTAMMHDNPPALYLVQQIDVNGVSSEIGNFVNDNRFFNYDEMTK